MYKSLVTILMAALILTSCVETQEEVNVIKPLPTQGTAEYQDLVNPSGSMSENMAKVNTIYAIIKNLLSEGNLEEVNFLAQSQLEIAQLIEYQKGEGLAYNALAIVSRRNGDTKSSLENHLKAYAIWETTNDQIGLAKSSINIGHLYRDNSLYEEAIGYYEKSIALLKDKRDVTNLIRVAQRNIGFSNQGLGELQVAERYYKIALDIAIEESNQSAINNLYNDLGYISELAENYEVSLSYYQRFLELSQSIDNQQEIARAYNNLGYVMSKLGNVDASIDYLNKAIAITDNDEINIRALQNLGLVHAEMQKVDKGISYLLKAEKIGAQLGVQQIVVDTYKDISTVYEKAGNIQKAIEYQKKLDATERSLKETEYQLVLQAAKDFKEVEVRYASFSSSLLVDALQSKYAGYFIAALFVVLALFVTSFYSSVYKMWRA